MNTRLHFAVPERFRGLRPDRPGFTLVEMLVVVGIIVLLLAIGTPIIFSARKQADRNRTRLDLNGIAMALEAYKADFGAYPRPATNARSHRLLGNALLAPLDVQYDGADGPGFKTSKVNEAGAPGGFRYYGRKYGPYLAPDKYKYETENITIGSLSLTNIYVLDRFGSRIDYFPRWKTPAGNLLLFGDNNGAGVYDNLQSVEAPTGTPPTSPAILYLLRCMGDEDVSGQVNGTEQLGNTPDYLLVSPGADKKYASDKAVLKDKSKFLKLDDVSNIDPQ